MTGPAPEPWSVVARNLPEHAGNPIHTDEGAKAAGFDRALVAGVTSYAYCCHPAIVRFGMDWVAGGEAEVRFRSPVFDQDHVAFPLAERPDGGIDVSARVERADRPLVDFSAWPSHRTDADGRRAAGGGSLREELDTVTLVLEGEYGSDYARRAGDDLDFDARYVHPAVWPRLANSVFHDQLVRGSWVHTRSVVRHFALVPAGVEAEISTVVVDRFHRHGARAVAVVEIRVDGSVAAVVEHEAIVDLSDS